MNLTTHALRALLTLATCAALAGIAGCSLNQSIAEAGKVDYKSASSRPPLEIPPDLVGPRPDDRYVVPERQEQKTLSGYQSARAAEKPSGEANVLPAGEGIRMQRAGKQRWIVVDQPAAKVWPLVRQFWLDNGFTYVVESPEAGILETEWNENRAKLPQDWLQRSLGSLSSTLYSTGERDKFRTRLETTPSGTEIYISHRGMIEVSVGSLRDQTRWETRPSDPDLEAEFLQRLIVKLGGTQDEAKKMLADVGRPEEDRVRLVGTGDQQSLEVKEEYDRAWRRVGLALDRGGFTVQDRDRSQGDYYVRYVDPEVAGFDSKPGFFARLFGRTDPKPVNAQEYLIKVSGEGQLTRVTVLSKDGKPFTTDADRRTASRILGLLRDQLLQ